jgi:hypothetical protein
VELKLLIITALIATSSLPLHAAALPPFARLPNAAPAVSGTQLRALTVENVRLEAAAGIDAEPATTLKFDLLNTTQQRLTEITVEISVTEKPSQEPGRTPSRMLVRPFKLQGDVILEPGHSVGFEVLLRRLSADCECAAHVRVVSVRFLLGEAALTSRSRSPDGRCTLNKWYDAGRACLPVGRSSISS